MIRLLAVDMDGTCLNPWSAMTDNTINILRETAYKGIIVVPATGRNLFCLPHRLAAGTIYEKGGYDSEKNKGLFRYVISSNGARVTDVSAKKTIYKSMLMKKNALDVLGECSDAAIGIASHVNNRYLLQGRLTAVIGRMIYGKDAGGVCCTKNMKEYIRRMPYDVEELQFYFAGKRGRDQIRACLSEKNGISAAYTSAYVEIFSAQTSKGKALTVLADKLGINKNEIACIGDGENDLPMFEAAGLRIAMGNGAEILKKNSDYVTLSNSMDGVAKAVKKYIL